MLYESIALPTELNWLQRQDNLVLPAAGGKLIGRQNSDVPLLGMVTARGEYR